MEKEYILSPRLICDLECILDGSFKPLTGFLNEKDYNSVVETMRLSTGQLWSIPIVLPVDKKYIESIKHDETIILKNDYGLPLARMYIEDVYRPNIKRECEMVYGGDDINHPYVKIVRSYGDDVYYIGGRVECINMPPHYDFMEDRNTPEKIKQYIRDNKWKTVVGFQTRNPMHRSHVELTKYALKQSGDPEAKLLLQPIVGITQDCDIDYYTRVKCYKLISKKYPEDMIKLSLLPLSMRMAGPREALWHSLIRKNYGCTHFIIGRDHAGPSSKRSDGKDFYGPYDAHTLVEKHKNEIGINIISSKMIVYVKELEEYRPIDEVPEGMEVLSISGTEQRRRLLNNEEIPEWFTYPDVVEELRKTVVPTDKKGFCIYFVGLSGGGKTTLASNLKTKLSELLNREITILDGDVVRTHLSKGLTFNKEDRSINVRRIGYVASEIVKHKGIVLCSNIAPYNEDRKYNRDMISKYGGYIEIFVDTPIEICEERDIKGLYKLARKGIIKQFTGISDPFERPEDSELILTDHNDIGKNLDKIINKLKELGYLL